MPTQCYSQLQYQPRVNSSLECHEYWGLKEPVFENTPDPKFYFPSSKHEATIQRLLYGLKAQKGAVLVSGDIGCGKTILSRELILKLPKDQYDIALIANPTFQATEFLKELLYQLGIDREGSKINLLHHLNSHLLKNHKNGVETIVVVDEAQAIQDENIFEELRLLLNFQLNDRFLLTLVIMGQPEIQDRIAAIPQLAQRIGVRSHLLPLNTREAMAYIQFRLKLGGSSREIFSQNALSRICKKANGIPRLINTLCDLSLLTGCLEKSTLIDEELVSRASHGALV